MPLLGLRLLDVGCGGGLLSMALVRLGAKVVGLDACERTIAIAQSTAKNILKHEQLERLHYFAETIENFVEYNEGSKKNLFYL